MPFMLFILFGVTALFYAAVGFGGGSTYNALLVLNGTDHRILPLIALGCNILVVTGGTIRFAREGHISLGRLAPFLVTSIPAALIGGRLPISETLFTGLLGGALLLSGIRMMLQGTPQITAETAKTIPTWRAAVTGLVIGGLSGIVGIGGGIFLAPILYWMNWGRPRQIAAACSVFILTNSTSGMFGQLIKVGDMDLISLAMPYWPLLLAVFVGGQIGSWLGAKGFQPMFIKRLTAILILYVAARLIWRWLHLA